MADRLGRTERTDSILPLVVVLDVEDGWTIRHGGEARKGCVPNRVVKSEAVSDSDCTLYNKLCPSTIPARRRVQQRRRE